MFPCDWCLSIHFVSFCVSTFAVCARAVSGNDRLVSSKLFMIFLIFISCKNNAISASCPQQKFHSSSRFPSLFLSSLGSLSISFLRAKLGECVALWLALTPPPTQMIDGTENPFKVCKHATRYNKFGYKLIPSGEKVVLSSRHGGCGNSHAKKQ